METLGLFCGQARFGHGSGRILASEAVERWLFRHGCRPLAGVTLAFAFGSLAIRRVPSQQQLAQGFEIAPQDPQGHIPVKAALAAVAAAFLTVAGLQGANRGLDARMMLSRFPKSHGGLLFLLTTLLGAFAGNTRRPHDRRQFSLILRGV